jgi:hypothetical protein
VGCPIDAINASASRDVIGGLPLGIAVFARS